MPRYKRPVFNKIERAVLSDILPYEIPVIFSNRHFYEFLVDNGIRIVSDNITWSGNSAHLVDIIKLLFALNVPNNGPVNHISISTKQKTTIPFVYKVSHKDNDFRELALIHPKSQLALVDFYSKYKDAIIYYCSISPFSIRKPYKVAKFTYHKDKTHYANLAHDHENKSAEEYDKEYENLKTFFVYHSISNVYKFYESYKYHRCEKKYDRLFKFDISKCFDSIYTHSLNWALLNKPLVKDKMDLSYNTFGGQFDAFMRHLNYGETNGIVIGPEFSRIFAELILQQIDYSVCNTLRNIGDTNIRYKIDYEAFRYVDDYFVFYNDDNIKNIILETFRLNLKEYRMYLNDSKSCILEKPIITALTRAKQRISDLFNDQLAFRTIGKTTTAAEIEEDQYSFYVSSNKLITKFKTVIKETDVAYKDVLNYALACIDRRAMKLIKVCNKLSSEQRVKQETEIAKAVLEILDFTFYLYSLAPRVNTTIKLCMILSKIIKLSKVKGNFNYDNKHLILKKIYDDVFLVLRKNKAAAYTQVETLYLLIALKELGREYRLPVTFLCAYFDIDLENRKCKKDLNYFCIIVILFYIENKSRYSILKDTLKLCVKAKFEEVSKNTRTKTTELILLLFDLMVCPYIDDAFKKEILALHDVTDEVVQNGLIQFRKFWFTKWTDFEFGNELDAKRSQQVY